ncbi:MAG TPA: hypothetical protein VE821_14205, partial [Pyrinomonadaceae bacterium]|nr:hypothetical protein [Pyrinomonadaceae bacterium]
MTRLPQRVDEIRLSHRHQQSVRAHAARQLAALEFPSDATQLARRWRAFLRLEDERLQIAARLGADGRWLAAARTFALDVLVAHAYRIAAYDLDNEQTHDLLQHDCAVVAIGGYGRCELAPYSDLDLLFLHEERPHAHVRMLVERTLHILWDA